MRRLILCVAAALASTSVAACSDSDPEAVMSLATVRDACSMLAVDDSSAEGATIALKAVPFMEVLAKQEAAQLGATGSLPPRDERHDFIDRAITEVRDECPGPLLDDVEAFMHDVIDKADG